VVFIEIKQRVNRATQKRRIFLPYDAAQRFLNHREVPEHSPEDAAVVEEIESLLWQYDLRAASIVRYRRQALVGSEYDIGLRVTFDDDLTYRVEHLELDEEHSGRPLFPPGWKVIEIKVNERIPYWLTELVAAHNLNLIRISKYCRSIELAQNLAPSAWRLVTV